MSNLAEKLIPSTILTPRDYQIEATQKCIEGFLSADRGQLSLPCGAGKTLVAVNIFDGLKSKITLVLLPSLALVKQTFHYWKKNSEDYFSYICVCSEKDIDKNDDDADISLEGTTNVISDPMEIRNFLNIKKTRVIFSTYQSLELIAEAIKDSEIEIDLAICDEAHKTAGMNKGLFGLIHDQSKIKVKKRLYMTATPRVWGKNVPKKKKDDSYLADMNDETIFGKTFFKMSHKEAIERGILVDYQILTIGISNIQVENYLNEHPYLNKEMIKHDIAYVLGLVRAIKDQNLKHVVSYHSTVAKAQAFNKLLRIVAPEIGSFHVNGKMSAKDRSAILSEFSKSEVAVITNSKCLTEGVDVPGIDAVYFCDPRNSTVDIVQAVGRALRTYPGKTKGSIIIPIFHISEGVVDEAIKESDFSTLCGVLEALGTVDDRMLDFITDMKSGLGKKSRNHEMFLGHEGALKIENFSEKLKEHILLTSWDRVRVKIQMATYQEFKETMQKLGINSHKQFIKLSISGKIPSSIPCHPSGFYKCRDEWTDWYDAFNKQRPLLKHTFEEAKAKLLPLGIKSGKQYQKMILSGELDKRFPSAPHQHYKDKRWEGYRNYLGNDWLEFEEAHAFVLSLGLKRYEEWIAYCKSGKKPKNIPSAPYVHYKDAGWVDWGNWLGTGNKRGGNNKKKKD